MGTGVGQAGEIGVLTLIDDKLVTGILERQGDANIALDYK
jgi:hypothetical protein